MKFHNKSAVVTTMMLMMNTITNVPTALATTTSRSLSSKPAVRGGGGGTTATTASQLLNDSNSINSSGRKLKGSSSKDKKGSSSNEAPTMVPSPAPSSSLAPSSSPSSMPSSEPSGSPSGPPSPAPSSTPSSYLETRVTDLMNMFMQAQIMNVFDEWMYQKRNEACEEALSGTTTPEEWMVDYLVQLLTTKVNNKSTNVDDNECTRSTVVDPEDFCGGTFTDVNLVITKDYQCEKNVGGPTLQGDSILDCNGNAITVALNTHGFLKSGVYVKQGGEVSIKNCIIENFLSGIRIIKADGIITIENTRISKNSFGIRYDGSSYVINVKNVVLTNNNNSIYERGYGILMVGGSDVDLNLDNVAICDHKSFDLAIINSSVTVQNVICSKEDRTDYCTSTCNNVSCNWDIDSLIIDR